MKKLILIITIALFSNLTIAQKTFKYLKSKDEVKGKRTVFTEIIIDKTPQEVREKFLEFNNWPNWNKVIPEIIVLNGDLNNLETKPKLDLTLDFGRKNGPQKSPANPTVFVNNKELFVWGINNGLFIKAEHVFVFLPTNDGKKTHLIHYERMSGIVAPFFMTKKLKSDMDKHYNIMNKDFKDLCEK